MEKNNDYIITASINNYAFLKQAFENYKEGDPHFKSRDQILDLMIRNQENLRNARKAKALELKENKKNNSSN